MRKLSRNPVLYQFNCRVLLRELSDTCQKPNCTLDDVPDLFLDHLRDVYGIEILYLLGVWTTGREGLEKAAEVMQSSNLPRDHICSSPFSVTEYNVHLDFGGDTALGRFRDKLRSRDIRLLIDFVPNHVAIDHPWLKDPISISKYIMPGSQQLIQNEPHNFARAAGQIVAHGKDPYFDGWTDTAQLNYFSSDLHNALFEILLKICTQADGVRCDMAMLVISEQMSKTWGDRYRAATNKDPQCPNEFWREAIKKVKKENPNFLFMAEVYWNLESELVSQGFDYCYDKGLYDHVRHGNVEDIKRAVDGSTLKHQMSLVRFLENHDEDRAYAAIRHLPQLKTLAALTYLSPGLKFFHWGQFEGRTYKMPMQQQKLPAEEPSGEVKDIYLRLLDALKSESVRNGSYYTIGVESSCEGCGNLLAFLWLPGKATTNSEIKLGVLNLDPWEERSGFASLRNLSRKDPGLGGEEFYNGKNGISHFQDALLKTAKTQIHTPTIDNAHILLRDLFGSTEAYTRSLQEFTHKGIWFSLKPWHSHLFDISIL